MKEKVSKKEAQEKIQDFFKRTSFSDKEARKIKRLAMKFNIKLRTYRKRFCKKCYNDLKNGKVRISKTRKIIVCEKCNLVNKFRIN